MKKWLFVFTSFIFSFILFLLSQNALASEYFKITQENKNTVVFEDKNIVIFENVTGIDVINKDIINSKNNLISKNQTSRSPRYDIKNVKYVGRHIGGRYNFPDTCLGTGYAYKPIGIHYDKKLYY